MKRWFIYISSIVIVLFLSLTLKASPDSKLFSMYPHVMVLNVPENLNWDELETSLQQLGEETQSLIALRIAQPSNEYGKTTRFTYVLFGEGKLPNGFVESSGQDKERLNPANTYSILSGTLSQEKLSETLTVFGAEVDYYPAESHIMRPLLYIGSPAIILCLIIFSLLFITIISMERIKLLRTSGIKVFSGISRGNLFKKAIIDDILTILTGWIISGVMGGIFLYFMSIWNREFLIFLITSAGLYALLLFISALFMELVFWGILRYSRIIDMIKGKMPIRSVLAVLIAGQLFAFIAVGYGAHMVTLYLPQYRELNRSEEEWKLKPDTYNFSYNIGCDSTDRDVQEQRERAWYYFAIDALENKDAFYVEHFLRETDKILHTMEETRKLLVVSPSYLRKEHLLTDESEIERMEHLSEGEFGLLFPENLSTTEQEAIAEKLRDFVGWRYWEAQQEQNNMPDIKEIIVHSAAHKPVFLYNYQAHPTNQYLNNAYIVVLSPQSTGKSLSSVRSWIYNIDSYLFLPSYEETLTLLEKHNLDKFVSHIKNSRLLYSQQIENYRNETISLVMGGLLGTVAAMAAFVVMNRLYFNYFRREIFIRRISGVSFFENHQNYLITQITVFGTGLVLSVLLTRNLVTSLGIFFLFLVLEVILLYKQMQAENRNTVTLLKGE